MNSLMQAVQSACNIPSISHRMMCGLQVTPLEAGILVGLYVVYVCATFYTSRADEPLHADLALHEFPPEDGGIGEGAGRAFAAVAAPTDSAL